MDLTALRSAYAAFIEAAETGPFVLPANPEKWTAEQIVAHMVIINQLLAAAMSELLAGRPPSFDNRPAIRAPHLRAIVAAAGDWPGLIALVRQSSAVVCQLAEEVEAETATRPFPVLLQTGETIVCDAPLTLAQILETQTNLHLPGHRAQLEALKG